MTNLYLHNNITTKIFKALKDNTLHNAIIFTGAKGVGKYTLAMQLANFILSHKIQDFINADDNFFSLENINKSAVNLIKQNTNENFLKITKSVDKIANIIGVEEVKPINYFLQSSGGEYYKIVLINYADILNINAANALLKNLEDTPKNTVFFLINHNYNSLLATIKSRCLALKFNNLTNDNLLQIANINNISIEDKHKQAMLSLANGSYANLLWFLNPENLNLYKIIIKSISNNDVYALMSLKNNISKLNAEDFLVVFDILEKYIYQRIEIFGVSKVDILIKELYNAKQNFLLLNLDKFITFFTLANSINNTP
jgi:DNA polymerase-3 subunit delta'